MGSYCIWLCRFMNEGVWLVNSQSLIEEKGFVCDGDISLAKAFLKLVRFQ